jgi:maleate isomerase
VTLESMTEVAGGERFESVAADLATVRPHAIAWMCTSGSFSRGPEWDAELRRVLSDHGRCPATTTSTALVTAFKALGVHKVALATPYESRLNEKLVQYVEHFGFEVVNHVGLGLTLDWDIGTLGSAALNELVRRADSPEAEARALEDDLGKPVFSANMASMWHALRLAGVQEAQPGLGALSQLSNPQPR